MKSDLRPLRHRRAAMCLHCSATIRKPPTSSHLHWKSAPSKSCSMSPCRCWNCLPTAQDEGIRKTSPCSQFCELAANSMLSTGLHLPTLACCSRGSCFLQDPSPRKWGQGPTNRTETCVWKAGWQSLTMLHRFRWPKACSTSRPSAWFRSNCSLCRLWNKQCNLQCFLGMLEPARSNHLDNFLSASHQVEWSLLQCLRTTSGTIAWCYLRRNSTDYKATFQTCSQLKGCRSTSLAAKSKIWQTK